ncbi:hypothetical protein C1T17_08560 [Sphingobium sp. SCG-1]|uniref:hypothetical protein n=1 Tax=Sphingobium sp. SCG-1 TaxID=2072936 RepID=UPI000CD691D1|nr:hypothetical protein [Sphingobium sp. SCG-1]AUW58152.1 hypothetical protein C1T17_08560 [Sphingobium sp. SCG-1]
MRFFRFPLAALVLVASCVAPPRQEPAPAPLPPVRAPAPAPAPVQPKDWRDWPLTAGEWRYQTGGSSSSATFGVAGALPVLTIRCELPLRQFVFAPAAARVAGQMVVRTTFGVASWPLQASTANPAQFVAVRAGSDPALDQIAFSRGRFVVEVPGAAPLVLPTWAEITRVIEDCRG